MYEPFVGGGLNYETAHFCEVLRAGEMESTIMSHDLSAKMIASGPAARIAGSRSCSATLTETS